MMSLRFLGPLCVVCMAHGSAGAQNAATLSDGKAFAESLAPQSAGQIVNPAGVSPAAWPTGSSAIPTNTPSGLGTFSSPLTSSPLYDVSGAQGALSGLGNAKILNCKNYVPTGDPVADQECAAVKFMNKDCVPLNNSQLQVVGAAGVAAAPGVDCSDTYGTGLSNFGYQNAITANDPVFHLTQNAQNNASAVTPQNCVSTPIITKPAQYETNQCNKTVSTDAHICTQELAVAITTSYSPATPNYTCPEGTLQGAYCVRKATSPASMTYFCPTGTLSGTLCMNNTSSPALIDFTCPNGGTLAGSTCTGSSIIPAAAVPVCATGTYNGQACVSTNAAMGVPSCPISSNPAVDGWRLINGYCEYYNNVDHTVVPPQFPIITYSCPNGGTLSGNTCTTTTTATLNYQCERGTLSGASCVIDESGPATPVYSCATGTLSGTQCVSSTSEPAIPDYHCPAGQTLNGALCESSTSTPATLHYSCPGGTPPVGNQCKTVLTQTNWIDNCLPYEQSAGVPLGAPK